MKALIILFTLLFMTLNSVSSTSMWMGMSAPQPVETVAETSSHCHKPHDTQMSTEDTQPETEAFNFCGMEDCQCGHLNTAKVPDDIQPYTAVFIGFTMPLAMAVPSLTMPFLPDNDRPPRIMSA